MRRWVSITIVLILQRKKLRQREGQQLAQAHTAHKWWSGGLGFETTQSGSRLHVSNRDTIMASHRQTYVSMTLAINI